MKFYVRCVLFCALGSSVFIYTIFIPSILRVVRSKTPIRCGNVQTLRSKTSPLQQSKDMKAEVECRFAERRNILQSACKIPNLRPIASKALQNIMMVSEGNASMCLIQKNGCMFWQRLFKKVMKERFPHDNPAPRISEGFEYVNLTAVSKRTKIVFVRNPYRRLFSAYVDKLFSMTPKFWNITGDPVLELTRYRNHPETRQPCAHDVTFREYVQYLIFCYRHSLPIEQHYNPIHRHCAFCDIQYDYIGKMETFVDDVVYVSSSIGALDYRKVADFVMAEFSTGPTRDAARHSWNLFHEKMPFINRCGITLTGALRVTWKRFQINGFISNKIPFPLKAESTNVTMETFNAIAYKAYLSSNKSDLSLDKDLALREAYASLSVQEKMKLRNIFKPEFVMFDYEDTPDFVFGTYEKTVDLFSFLEKKYD